VGIGSVVVDTSRDTGDCGSGGAVLISNGLATGGSAGSITLAVDLSVHSGSYIACLVGRSRKLTAVT
jgi:hypothetical protein